MKYLVSLAACIALAIVISWPHSLSAATILACNTTIEAGHYSDTAKSVTGGDVTNTGGSHSVSVTGITGTVAGTSGEFCNVKYKLTVSDSAGTTSVASIGPVDPAGGFCMAAGSFTYSGTGKVTIKGCYNVDWLPTGATMKQNLIKKDICTVINQGS